MPDDRITIVSTTDTQEQVEAALGVKAEAKADDAPAEQAGKADPSEPDKPAEKTPAEGTEGEDASDDAKVGDDKAPEATKPPVKPAAKADDADDEDDEPDDEAKQKATRKQQKLNHRAAQLAREKGAERARREQAERENEELKRQLAEAKKPAEPAKPEEKKPTEVVATDPGPQPKLDDFDTTEDWSAATATWFDAKAKANEARLEAKVEAKLKAQRAEDEQARVDAENRRAAEASRAKWIEKVEKAKEKHEDWDETIEAAESVELSPPILATIANSEAGAEIFYYLAQNTEEVDRIKALNPTQQLRELGKLELRHELGTLLPESATEDDAPAKPRRRVAVSKAPKPPAKVPAGRVSQAVPLDDPKLSQAEFNRRRQEQIEARGRRN